MERRLRSPPEMPRTLPPPTTDAAISCSPISDATRRTTPSQAFGGSRMTAANRRVSSTVSRLKNASSW